MLTADAAAHSAINEFREHMGDARLTLRQKRLAMRGLMHICLPLLGDMSSASEARLSAVIHEWSHMRAPLEPDFPVERMGLGLIAIAECATQGAA